MVKIPWKSEWLPTSGFSPGEFHRQRNLVGYNPWSLQTIRHDWVINTHIKMHEFFLFYFINLLIMYTYLLVILFLAHQLYLHSLNGSHFNWVSLTCALEIVICLKLPLDNWPKLNNKDCFPRGIEGDVIYMSTFLDKVGHDWLISTT